MRRIPDDVPLFHEYGNTTVVTLAVAPINGVPRSHNTPPPGAHISAVVHCTLPLSASTLARRDCVATNIHRARGSALTLA